VLRLRALAVAPDAIGTAFEAVYTGDIITSP